MASHVHYRQGTSNIQPTDISTAAASPFDVCSVDPEPGQRRGVFQSQLRRLRTSPCASNSTVKGEDGGGNPSQTHRQHLDRLHSLLWKFIADHGSRRPTPPGVFGPPPLIREREETFGGAAEARRPHGRRSRPPKTESGSGGQTERSEKEERGEVERGAVERGARRDWSKNVRCIWPVGVFVSI